MPTIRPISTGASEADLVSRMGNLLEPATPQETAPSPEPAEESEPTRPTEPEADETEESVEAIAEDDGEDDEPETAIEPPSSWSDAEKELFREFPPEAQGIIVARENEREGLLTRKSQEISQQRKEYETAVQNIQAERQHYEQTLRPMLEQLHSQVQQDETRLLQYIDPNSDNYDPQAYIAERARLDHQRGELQRAQQEQMRLEQARQHAEQQALSAEIARNEELLVQAIPEWKNPDKARNELKEIQQYAISQGVPSDLAEQEYRAPMIQIVRKAKAYDALMSKQPELAKKLKAAPKIQKPGVKKQVNTKQEKHTAARRQLRRARGRTQEAQAFIEAFKTM